MTNFDTNIRHLADEIQPPKEGKRSVVLMDNADAKVMLFAFAAGAGLPAHVAPLPAILHLLSGEAALTVEEESVSGKPGTWIQMPAKTPHSIQAKTPTVLLLTLIK